MSRPPNTKLNNSKQKENPDFMESRAKNTPVYDKSDFFCPENFNKAEQAEWFELVDLIRSMKNGAVTDADRKTMIIRTQAWVEYLRFDEELKKRNDTYLLLPKPGKEEGSTVYVHVRNRNYELKQKALDTVLKCDGELGITPISRSKIGLSRAKFEQESCDNALTGLMNRRGDND